MQNPSLSLHVRAVLESPPEPLPLQDLLIRIDEFVIDSSSSSDPKAQLLQLEEDLQKVHHDVVDHSALFQTEVLLAVLYHLGPILPPTSVISWFDLVLRPALREPKLPTTALNHAKDLIISALRRTEETFLKKLGDFRRRLFDLYLLDAFNDGSGDDVLEWAELDEEQKAKRSHWKWNLEDILLKLALEQPQVSSLPRSHFLSTFELTSFRIYYRRYTYNLMTQLLVYSSSYFFTCTPADHPSMRRPQS